MPDLAMFSQLAKEQGYSDEEINSFVSAIPKEGQIPSFDGGAPTPYMEPQGSFEDVAASQGFSQKDISSFSLPSTSDRVVPQGAPLTQKYGARNHRYDNISGGINRGADFALPAGTPIAVPEGEWEVVESFGDAQAAGPGNRQSMINRGYGNSVLVKNRMTGEMLRFSHLSQVGAKPGQLVKGGDVVGASGATGHVAGQTGEHLDVEYIDGQGRLNDVLRSPYGGSFR